MVESARGKGKGKGKPGKSFAPIGRIGLSLCMLGIFGIWGPWACGPAVLVPIATRPAVEQTDPATFEILIRSSIADPLPLRGSRVAYSQLGPALSQEISVAAQPWVARNRERAQKTDGWQLLLGITEADASYRHGRARVNITLRATLRTRTGNQHLSQTQTYCQRTAEVAETAASTVFEACLHDLRTELSRWLGGVNP